MNFFLPLVLVLLLGVDFFLVTSSRLMHCIKLAAFQGFLIGILPLCAKDWSLALPGAGIWIIAFLSILIKSILLPYMFKRAIKRAGVGRELEPLVGYSVSLAAILIASGAIFYFCSKLPMPAAVISPIAAPAAMTTMVCGLFLIVARRKAITQAVGFLVFENGITAFAVGMGFEHTMLIELGILFDVMVLILVIGITVFGISREFQHIDADRLNKLDDITAPEAEYQVAEEK
jgi:hydrogenase-4 component E